MTTTIRTKLFGDESRNTVFLAATGIVLGFTHFWAAGVSILVVLFLWRKWFVYWNEWILGATGIVLVSSIWSSDPVAGVLFFISVNVLYAFWKSPVDKELLFTGIVIGIMFLASLAYLEIVILHDPRPETFLVKDASLLGLIGMSGISPLAGIAGSRTAVAGIWIFALLTGKRFGFILAVAASVMLFTPTIIGLDNSSRFTIQGIEQSDSLRDEISTSPTDVPWYGYGFHSYVLETESQRPHNIFILSWYELGIFSIPFWILLLFALPIPPKFPFRFVAIVIPVGLMTDEFFSRPEGLFVLFNLGLLTHVYSSRIRFFTRFYGRIKEQRRDVPANS